MAHVAPLLPDGLTFQFYRYFFKQLCSLYETWLRTRPFQLASFRANILAYKLRVQELDHLTHDERLYLHYYLVIHIERMEDAAAGLL